MSVIKMPVGKIVVIPLVLSVLIAVLFISGCISQKEEPLKAEISGAHIDGHWGIYDVEPFDPLYKCMNEFECVEYRNRSTNFVVRVNYISGRRSDYCDVDMVSSSPEVVIVPSHFTINFENPQYYNGIRDSYVTTLRSDNRYKNIGTTITTTLSCPDGTDSATTKVALLCEGVCLRTGCIDLSTDSEDCLVPGDIFSCRCPKPKEEQVIASTTTPTPTMEPTTPICGNEICEPGEHIFCLDCPINCESEYCNSKINIVCDDCLETQKTFLPIVFDYQNTVYDCLSNYFGYNPSRILPYRIESSGDVCSSEYYCMHVGTSSAIAVNLFGFAGIVEPGENSVMKQENLRSEIHETTHVFTYYALGTTPSWFDEGVAIQTNSRLLCHPKQLTETRMDENNYQIHYDKLKSGEWSLDTIGRSSHMIGSLFMIGLEKDYSCDKDCVADILYSLHQYREDTGSKDLTDEIITNKIVKQKAEEVIGKDLTPLFNLLEIGMSGSK